MKISNSKNKHKNVSRVLVANRGEIAVRVIRALKDLGIESVAAVSEADKNSLPARLADRVICIGPPQPRDSYLNIHAIIHAALGTNSDAIHPGYGFLAENPELAESCEKQGIIFIGPRSESIRQMGNKLLARNITKNLGIPVIPGSREVINLEQAMDSAEKMEFPLLLKAAAGGGGRGLKIVMKPGELKTCFETASIEAYSAFADNTLYIEQYIPNARHIEVQILSDHFGNVIHVGERDCSLQRRYQKVIEEAPATGISDKLRADIHRAGVSIAKKVKYESAGTIEFILDQDTGQFYFLEMNTRIQVEHPVTEMISGIDLIKEQIKIADDHPLPLSQADVKLSGHAIECRINAESPEQGFQPCPGRITSWVEPNDPGIRVDSHCYEGYFVPPYYDSLIAKVIATGMGRYNAIEKMQSALQNFVISGIPTTIPFIQLLLSDPDFINMNTNTRWLEDNAEKFYISNS